MFDRFVLFLASIHVDGYSSSGILRTLGGASRNPFATCAGHCNLFCNPTLGPPACQLGERHANGTGDGHGGCGALPLGQLHRGVSNLTGPAGAILCSLGGAWEKRYDGRQTKKVSLRPVVGHPFRGATPTNCKSVSIATDFGSTGHRCHFFSCCGTDQQVDF